MRESFKKFPHRTFGIRLKQLREHAKETLAEVSGAVEIDVAMLEKIEQGRELPPEDILMLLMNHFEVQDEDAVKLWELAGYTKDGGKDTPAQKLEEVLGGKQLVMLVPVDNRVMYTDSAKVVPGKNGFVVEFTQSGSAEQQVPIARVGMSKDSLIELHDALCAELERMDAPVVPKALLPARTKSQRQKRSSDSK